jgi:hypothetical protein
MSYYYYLFNPYVDHDFKISPQIVFPRNTCR